MLSSLLLAAAAVPDFNKRYQPEDIPVPLRGAWDSSTDACKKQLSVDRVHIGIDWIGFFESGGRLQIMTHAGIPDFEESRAIRFVMAGEGSTWDFDMVVAWNGTKPSRITWIEAKSEENMDEKRRQWQLVRCASPTG